MLRMVSISHGLSGPGSAMWHVVCAYTALEPPGSSKVGPAGQLTESHPW